MSIAETLATTEPLTEVECTLSASDTGTCATKPIPRLRWSRVRPTWRLTCSWHCEQRFGSVPF